MTNFLNLIYKFDTNDVLKPKTVDFNYFNFFYCSGALKRYK